MKKASLRRSGTKRRKKQKGKSCRSSTTMLSLRKGGLSESSSVSGKVTWQVGALGRPLFLTNTDQTGTFSGTSKSNSSMTTCFWRGKPIYLAILPNPEHGRPARPCRPVRTKGKSSSLKRATKATRKKRSGK